ncbi:MAG: OmpH family outer membrane protein [Candidatus Pacebacteria bacterium]|nr:OmpH family outer membrane protein [Candidatus Paceibacterota bacterium]
MNRWGIRVMCWGALIIGCTTPFVYAQDTVRYINMQKAFRGYYKTADSEASLKKQEDLIKERAEEMTDQLKKLKERLDLLEERSLNVALSDEARTQTQKEARQTGRVLETKQQEFREFVGEKQQELRKQYVRLRNTLTQEIIEYVRAYAEDHDIDTVMDVSGMSNNLLPVVIRYPDEKEITDTILAGLNQGHEEEVPVDEDVTDEGATD